MTKVESDLNTLANSIRKELQGLLEQEEVRLRSSFPLDRRIGLMEIARSMDTIWVLEYFADEETNIPVENLQMATWGINRALLLLMDKSYKSRGFPLSPSSREMQSWALSLLVQCGRLGLVEHLLEINRVGLCNITKPGEAKFVFSYTKHPVGIEAYERDSMRWVDRLISEYQEPKLELLHNKIGEIRNLMVRLVRPWRGSYIQYETHPVIDVYFQEYGLLLAQRMYGQDCFPGDATFGGYEFDLYRATVAILVGWSLKHINFCSQLISKHPNLELQNLLTIFQFKEEKATYLSAALDIDIKSAEQSIDILTLTRDNNEALCSVPGNFVAPSFIEAGREYIICPIWGCLSNPFQFMLDELRRRYPEDWDRAVNRRESLFREELYQLFPQNRFFNLRRNLILRDKGKIITDIDALIYDHKTGIVGLFQLKWQDFYRGSIRKRESQKRNIIQSCNKWIERVSHWLSGESLDSLAMKIEADGGINSPVINGVRLFVIGRLAVQFSGEGEYDSNAAWGTWYKLVSLVQDCHKELDPISCLFRNLERESPLNKPRPQLSLEEIKIGSTEIVVEDPWR